MVQALWNCHAHEPRGIDWTAVRTFERAGVSRSVAMSIVGHKTASNYRRYPEERRRRFEMEFPDFFR